jgi:hypothetical protein
MISPPFVMSINRPEDSEILSNEPKPHPISNAAIVFREIPKITELTVILRATSPLPSPSSVLRTFCADRFSDFHSLRILLRADP